MKTGKQADRSRRTARMAAIILLGAGVVLLLTRPHGDTHHLSTSQTRSFHHPDRLPEAAPEDAHLIFRAWMSHEALSSTSLDDTALHEGVRLAKERMVRMRELMISHPDRALAESLTLSEWHRLPEEIKPYVEEPFSEMADIDLFIACSPDAAYTEHLATLPDGRTFRTFSVANPRRVKTKQNIPLQGIHLADLAVARNRAFQPLSGADLDTAEARYPTANQDPGRCFATGKPIAEHAAAALAGGRLFYFKDTAALNALENKLTALDQMAGPASAFPALLANASTNGVDLIKMEQLAVGQSDAWAASTRNMYVILVDFDDKPGQPIDPATLENLINTTVSQQINEMSHRKTRIECTVSTNIYRMPWLSSTYESDHRPMHDHAVAAVLADGIDLSYYQTVCVYFTDIPGLTLAGYASIGGSKMWLHNTANPYVITHELGHNYGSYHAHSWNVSGNDPVDPAGVHEEYGDILDIMGSGQLPAGHFHIQNQLEVEWIETSHIADVTGSGTYRVYRTDHPDTDPAQAPVRGLRIEKNATNAYWVGYRQLYPEHEYYGRGTYMLWQQPNPSNYPKCHLLDMTPGSAGGKEDGGLALGQTYSDPAAQVHITPVRRGGSVPNEWMDVTVNIGGFPTNHAPAASISGPTNGANWQSMTFTVEASDPDGDKLAYFWDFGDGLIKDNTPVISHAWTSVGLTTGTVRCTVSDMKGGTATDELNVVVSNGLLWPHQQIIFATDIFDIATDGTRLVAVGRNGFVGTSTNATDWSTANVGGAGYTYVYLESILHDGTQFIAVGADYSTNPAGAGVVYTSPDGSTWTRRFINDGPALSAVAGNGSVRVAVGADGTVLRSTTGLYWSTLNPGITGDLRAVSHGGGLFCAVGAATNGGSIAYVSVDGINWIDRSDYAGTGGWVLTDIENCNGQLLAGGAWVGIRRSIDGGQNFSVATADYLHIPAFAYGNGIYFAAGNYSYGSQQDIDLLSNDGISWSAIPTASQNNRTAAVFFNNRFITVGKGGSVWSSGPVNSPEGGWALWQYHNRSSLGLNRDAGDDADGDGVLNLVEYALGTVATDPLSVPSIHPGFDETDHLVMVIDRTRMAGDIDYLVERSTNLLDTAGWSSLETEIISNTSTRLAVRSIHPVAARDSEFLRLSIKLNSSSP